jgi:hypothetical protein
LIQGAPHFPGRILKPLLTVQRSDFADGMRRNRTSRAGSRKKGSAA